MFVNLPVVVHVVLLVWGLVRVVDLIVTGAGGRLGRILQAAWAEGGVPLRPVWTGRGAGLPVEWDLLADMPKGLPRGAVVLHLAGATPHGRHRAMLRNVALVPPLLRMCRETGARRLLFMSSAAVYPPGGPWDEAAALAPSNPYGRSKAEAEALIRAQSHTPVTILRPGNIAGADALLGPRAPEEILLDPVPGQLGGPLRSWIGARMLAHALAALCQRDLPPVLNLVQSPPLRMGELLQASGLPWRYGATPAAVPVATQDTALLQTILPLPRASPARLAAEAAWARGVLA